MYHVLSALIKLPNTYQIRINDRKNQICRRTFRVMTLIILLFFPLHLGGDSCSRGGGNWDRRSMSLNTDYGVIQENKGILEELFIHEGAHASLDGTHLHVISFFRNECHKDYGSM